MIRRDGGRAPGSDTDHTVLQPGMVVTLEPTICFSERGDIFVSIEDQFLVTESGGVADAGRAAGSVRLRARPGGPARARGPHMG